MADQHDQTIDNMNPMPDPDLRELNQIRNTKQSSESKGPQPGDREEDLETIATQGALPKEDQRRATPNADSPGWQDQLRDATRDLPEDNQSRQA